MKTGKLTTVGAATGVVISRQYLSMLGWIKGDVIIQEIRGQEIVLRNVEAHKVSLTHQRRAYGDGAIR